MKIEKFSLGILGANCYLLINEETKDTVVVDPGGHSKKFTAYIEEEKLNLVAILLTHGHFDHIMGIDSILENWNIPVYVEEEDLPIMTDPELNLSTFASISTQAITPTACCVAYFSLSIWIDTSSEVFTARPLISP